MIAEVGHLALTLAFGLSLIAVIFPILGAERGEAGLMAAAAPLSVGQFVLTAIAFGCLTTLYLTSDFSVLNVAVNSHTAKPWLYKVSGVWGNHEGSLLLWVLILTLFAAAVAIFGHNLPTSFKARVLGVQSMIATGFFAFMLFTSNPFQRIDPAPIEGQGLNPLLQDPGLAFHPPMLYLGYVGFSIAFSFAIAALLERQVSPAWARWVRPWTLAAWCALTAGIALGSWWAYYELGWGGWWFWDPVENASFMPWLAGTALLHSAIVVEKRDALKSWTILLAIITFSLSLLGTFLVRSGVLTSVHAFAVDPERGVFILGFLTLVIGGSLTLFALRAGELRDATSYRFVSREGGLLLNNLLLAVSTAVVFIGTLYPLFLDALTGQKVSVGPPFYEIVFVPLMTVLILAMGAGPLLSWRRGNFRRIARRLVLAIVAAVIAAVGLALVTGLSGFMAFFGFGLGIYLAGAVGIAIGHRIRLFDIPLHASLKRLARLPRSAWAMSIAHLGIAITALGIVASEAWTVEKLGVMSVGDRIAVGPYEFRFDGVSPAGGPNYTAIRGRFTVFSDGREIAVLTPEERNFTTPPMETTEAAIRPRPIGDLYAVIGDPLAEGGWSVRLYFKPLVSWIWAGALFMAFGGLISLTDRRLRIAVTRKTPLPQAAAAE